MSQFLSGGFPGQLPPVSRDLHNVVLPIDLSSLEGIQLVKQIELFIKRLVPVRFGLVPIATAPESIAQLKVAHYLQESYGLTALAEYLEQVIANLIKNCTH